ncbi:MAG: class I SAM-dependent methyltransferase, partial [Syntrophales bacterium LBB04]|nr:class I SAM-dependent methyltransferase [Syntrophales bacterium LBB04]
KRILDIGCGPGYLLDYLPDVDYVGFDTDPGHIRYASQRYTGRGQFHCEQFTERVAGNIGRFDWIFMFGLLHHIDDNEAVSYLTLARDLMNPGGRLISLDGVFCKKQSPISRLLLSLDEGKFVRTEKEYTLLASGVFPSIRSVVRHDMFYFPYTIISDCRIDNTH